MPKSKNSVFVPKKITRQWVRPDYVPTNKELDEIRDRYIEQGGRITKCPDGVAHGVKRVGTY